MLLDVVPPSDLWKKKLDDDLTAKNFFDICLAAKKKIQKTIDGVTPLMLHTEIGRTTIYTIESPNGIMRNRITIRCPSYPEIYVHFEKNVYHMVAIIVESQTKQEDLKGKWYRLIIIFTLLERNSFLLAW